MIITYLYSLFWKKKITTFYIKKYRFNFFVLRRIRLRGLFNARAIIVKEQQGISPRENIREQLEQTLA